MKEPVKIQFIRSNPDITLPRRATEFSAGFDLCSDGAIANYVEGTVTVHTGLRVAFPKTHVLKIYGRSGLSFKGIRLVNSVGIIDADYRGEILLKYKVDEACIAMVNAHAMLQNGNRVAQAILEELTPTIWEEVDELQDTIRGVGGFGSTGA